MKKTPRHADDVTGAMIGAVNGSETVEGCVPMFELLFMISLCYKSSECQTRLIPAYRLIVLCQFRIARRELTSDTREFLHARVFALTAQNNPILTVFDWIHIPPVIMYRVAILASE
jgi:hypothetical protein